jgi:hypothetical protein
VDDMAEALDEIERTKGFEKFGSVHEIAGGSVVVVKRPTGDFVILWEDSYIKELVKNSTILKKLIL